jgi:hypothetical protein
MPILFFFLDRVIHLLLLDRAGFDYEISNHVDTERDFDIGRIQVRYIHCIVE